MTAITVDAHIDIPWVQTKIGRFDLSEDNEGRFSQVDFPRMKEGGLQSAVFALYLSDGMQDQLGKDESLNYIFRQLAFLESQTGCVLVDDPQVAIDTVSVGMVPIFLCLEGGRLIYNDLSLLRAFRTLGVRYLTVTHNRTTDWADSATDLPRHKGLTMFGRNVVHEANRIGVLMDVSHGSEATANAVIDESSLPVIASHSGCHDLTDHPRNLSDNLIRRIAKTKGFIGIPWARRFVGNTWMCVVDHIDYVTQLVGPSFVGVGSDLDGAELVTGITSVASWKRIVTEELADRGFSNPVIADITGGNLLRVFSREL